MLISLCIVAYNEENYLENLFNDIKEQTFPHENIEVILIDSLSTDRTREMMEKFKEINDFKDIRIYNNPKKIQAAGWNIAISEAKGDIVTRVDAHSTIPSDFIEKIAQCMQEGEFVCGGFRPNVIKDKTKWKETLLIAESSMFGSSIASYRRESSKSYVDSLFHASYRREVFEKVGGFNEYLGRTEDNEFHYRVRKAGYKICLDPKIVSYQYIRPTLKKMLNQKYGNGFWIGRTVSVCPKCLSWFHFVPFLFVMSLLLSFIFFQYGYSMPLYILLIMYFIADFIITIFSFSKNKKNKKMVALPVLFLLLHLSYGIGTLFGLLDIIFWKQRKDAKKLNELKFH